MKKLFAAALVCMGTLGYGGYRMYRFAVPRDMVKIKRRKTKERKDVLAEYRSSIEQMRKDLEEMPYEKKQIVSFDGLKLYARRFRPENPQRIVLCAHGYRGSAVGDFYDKVPFLTDMGCELWLIEQRSCGISEGDAVTFGALESRDIVRWTEEIMKESGLPVYLYGISLGASSVLMTADQVFPRPVSGIIADCGFSSMKDILRYLTKRWLKLPADPFFPVLDALCRIHDRFRITDADMVKALKHSRVPVLFMHGTEDHFVPADNSLRNYEACSSKKELILTEGAVHNGSHLKDPKRYEEAVREFFAHNDGKGTA